MTRYDGTKPQDEVEFDEDYYVIDERPAPAREPSDYRVVREQLLELVPTAPRFQVYWTVPVDLDWAED
jgi:hypothetical protein